MVCDHRTPPYFFLKGPAFSSNLVNQTYNRLLTMLISLYQVILCVFILKGSEVKNKPI